MFPKALFPRDVKRCHCVEWVNLKDILFLSPVSYKVNYKGPRNLSKTLNPAFLVFLPQYFLLYQRQTLSCEPCFMLHHKYQTLPTLSKYCGKRRKCWLICCQQVLVRLIIERIAQNSWNTFFLKCMLHPQGLERCVRIWWSVKSFQLILVLLELEP